MPAGKLDTIGTKHTYKSKNAIILYKYSLYWRGVKWFINMMIITTSEHEHGVLMDQVGYDMLGIAGLVSFTTKRLGLEIDSCTPCTHQVDRNQILIWRCLANWGLILCGSLGQRDNCEACLVLCSVGLWEELQGESGIGRRTFQTDLTDLFAPLISTGTPECRPHAARRIIFVFDSLLARRQPCLTKSKQTWSVSSGATSRYFKGSLINYSSGRYRGSSLALSAVTPVLTSVFREVQQWSLMGSQKWPCYCLMIRREEKTSVIRCFHLKYLKILLRCV